jgi:ATP-dependent protease Clp ATPase subunit
MDCSFCGKNSKDVKKMIGSAIGQSAICENCLAACTKIILNECDLTPAARLRWEKNLSLLKEFAGTDLPRLRAVK